MRPPNYAGPIVVVLLIMLIMGMLYMRRDNIDFIYSTNFWGFVSVVSVGLGLENQSNCSLSFSRPEFMGSFDRKTPKFQ